MAENLTLARPYAEAAFSLARDAANLAAWDLALSRLSAVAANAQAQVAMSDPRASDEAVSGLLSDVAGDLSAEQLSFVRVLVANGRAVLLPEIAQLFAQLKNTQEGVRDANVSSAFALTEAQQAQLAADLEARFGKVRLSVAVDPELIGGVRIAVGDQVIDASVRGKLATMATALQN